jgi:hypothetical protein
VETLYLILAEADGGQKLTPPGTGSPCTNVSTEDHDFWKRVMNGKEKLQNRDSIQPMLELIAFHAGDNYATALELCFFPKVEIDDDQEEVEASLYTQKAISEALSNNIF